MQFKIRKGLSSDSSELAILADMATRGLTSFLWGGAEPDGTSALGECRKAIRDDENHALFHARWQVAEFEGQVLGALHGHIIQASSSELPSSNIDLVVQPLTELKATTVGSWYTSAIAVFPEAQGMSVGSALLTDAETQCKLVGGRQLTLMVGSFNDGAKQLYARLGYFEVERRDFTSFCGSDPNGQWILMAKPLANTTQV